MAEEKKLKKNEEPDPEMLKHLRLMKRMDLYLMVRDLKLGFPKQEKSKEAEKERK